MTTLENYPDETSTTPASKEYLFKVLVIGEFGVGKTSIIRRYTEGYFSPNYKLTIGVDFALKTLQWGVNTNINLQLWDIAGHERFGNMTRVYYKYAVAAVIVFDLTRPATNNAVIKWLDDVREKVTLNDERPIPVLLLANKCDMEGVDTEFLNTFCREHDLIAWFPTSAKDDVNIDESMNFLVGKIIENTTNTTGISPLDRTSGSQLETVVLHDDDDSDDERDRRKDKCC